MESAEGNVSLTKRQIEVRLRIFDHALVLAVLDNADNFDERSGSAFSAEAFAEGILIGPEFLGHGLIDDSNGERLLLVGVVEGPPVTQGDAQGIKISRRNRVVLHARGLVAWLNRMALDVYGVESTHDTQGYGESLRDGDDARKSAKARFQFAIKSAALNFLITDLLNVEGEIKNVGGIEPEINILRLAEASNEQTGDDQQYQRACYLRDDERAADKLTAATARRAAGTVVQHRTDVAASDAQSRENTDDYAGDKRRPERKEIDPCVGQELQQKRQIRTEGNGTEKAHGPIGEEHAATCAEKSKQQTFREVLPHEPQAAGAEGGSNGHFAPTRVGANQQNVRDVEASHE